GGTGLYEQFFGGYDLVSQNVDADGTLLPDSACFDALSQLPLGSIFATIAIFLVAIFFITSSDSGSLVIDMLASGGHPNPPIWSRVTFAVLEGLVAAALLLAGGLVALQSAALATALPFSVVILAMCWANIRALRVDHQILQRAESMRRLDALASQMTDSVATGVTKSHELEVFVDDRIDYQLTRSHNWSMRRRPAEQKKDKGGAEPAED